MAKPKKIEVKEQEQPVIEQQEAVKAPAVVHDCFPVLSTTANGMVDISKAANANAKAYRMEQLAREHPEVRELLDELIELRAQ